MGDGVIMMNSPICDGEIVKVKAVHNHDQLAI